MELLRNKIETRGTHQRRFLENLEIMICKPCADGAGKSIFDLQEEKPRELSHNT